MIPRVKQIVLLAVLVCGLLAPAAPAGPAATRPAGPPAAIPLSGGWQFAPDPHDQGTASGWQLGRTGKGWRSVSLPHVFDARPLSALFHGSVGWYRLRFRTPSAPAGFGWAARFEESRRLTRVWLNGRFLGSHGDPYTPFQLGLGALAPGHTNALVVRVDNRKGVQPREGWWNWGGLVRPVSLVPLGPVTVSQLGIMPDLTCSSPGVCSGRLVIQALVTNRTAGSVTPTLKLLLSPPRGSHDVLQAGTIAPGTLHPGQSFYVNAAVPLSGPLRTWSPDRPNLYGASLDTLDGAALVQRDQLAIGMRRVENRGGLLYLNGRQIDLRGASIEEDALGRGPALTTADQVRAVDELRALHANVTRSQYPLSEGLLQRLDRAGILVWTQAPIYHRDDLLHTAAERTAAITTLADSVLATRNHACILTQSIANELTPTPDTVPGTKAYIDAAVPIVHALDPSVPVSIDLLSYPNFPAQQTYQQFDLLGISNYYGWYAGQRGHSTANIGGLAPFLHLTHARYPTKALVMTEFGAEATLPGPATEKQTFAFQSGYIEKTLATVATLPFVNGAIYWTLREFAVKPNWDGGPPRPAVPHTSIHHKGLITYAGRPKPAFAVAAGLFAATPLYRSPAVPGGVASPGGSGPPGSGDATALWALLGLYGLLAVIRFSSRGRRHREGADEALLSRAR